MNGMFGKKQATMVDRLPVEVPSTSKSTKISNKNSDEKKQNIPSIIDDEFGSCNEALEYENRKNSMIAAQQTENWSQFLVSNDKICFETDARTWSVEKVASFVNDILLGNKTVDEEKESVANHFKKQRIDGEALLMLTQDDIVDHFHVPLGEAIKLYHSILILKQKTPILKALEYENRKNSMIAAQHTWLQYLVLNDKICLETDARTWSVEKVASFVNDILIGNKTVDEKNNSVANRFKEQVIDGEAFLMLSQDEIMDTFHVPLGGALKLYNSIIMLRRKTPIFDSVDDYFSGLPTT